VDRLELRNRLLAAASADLGLLVISLESAREPLAWAPILLAATMGPVRTSALAGALDLSSPRVRSMLAAMVGAGWLAPIGDRRGRSYRSGSRLDDLSLRSPSVMDRLRAGGPVDHVQRGPW
jgi:Mn-dependent DtxR family transcriptional regulator